MLNKITALISSILLVVTLSGCATQANKDPLEGLNRGIYKFNDTADKAVIKPIAGAYKAVLPSPLRTGVNNFFDNLGTLITFVNNVLQFKFNHAMDDAGRFVVNSTFGILGLIDVASMDNIPEHSEDFGQTLGYWGLGNGPYLVLPFIGPSTMRDATGFVVDFSAFYPISYIDHVSTRNQLLILGYIDTRAQYLPASDLLDDAALDPYSFMRDAYLQRRASQVADGEAVEEDDSFYEDEFISSADDTDPTATE
jgi:phospholipid-binding lipoprotein MlaA